jgi:hypothetical protein
VATPKETRYQYIEHLRLNLSLTSVHLSLLTSEQALSVYYIEQRLHDPSRSHRLHEPSVNTIFSRKKVSCTPALATLPWLFEAFRCTKKQRKSSRKAKRTFSWS